MNPDYVPFFHVGTLVRDIDQAAADFAQSAMVTGTFERLKAQAESGT